MNVKYCTFANSKKSINFLSFRSMNMLNEVNYCKLQYAGSKTIFHQNKEGKALRKDPVNLFSFEPECRVGGNDLS